METSTDTSLVDPDPPFPYRVSLRTEEAINPNTPLSEKVTENKIGPGAD